MERWAVCVATETRHLDRLGQLGELDLENNTDSEQEGLRPFEGCLMDR